MIFDCQTAKRAKIKISALFEEKTRKDMFG